MVTQLRTLGSSVNMAAVFLSAEAFRTPFARFCATFVPRFAALARAGPRSFSCLSDSSEETVSVFSQILKFEVKSSVCQLQCLRYLL